MKILLIITDYGSFNNFLSELAKSLAANGNDVSVICSQKKVINIDEKYDYKSLGIKIYFCDFPRGYNLFKQIKSSLKIRKFVNGIDPDLVHVHFTTGIFTTLLLGKLKYTTLGTFHGLGYTKISGKLRRIIFRKVEFFCFNKLDQIWLLNTEDFEVLKNKFPNKVFKYRSLGFGCDLSRFDPKRYSLLGKNSLKSKLRIKENDFVIIYIGRFVDFKGFHLVINAFRKLSNEIDDVKLLLIGGEDKIHPTGLGSDGINYRDEQGIINVGFSSEVEKYLSISDLLVFPSIREGMPVCVIESLAMEVPALVANSRGSNELIRDNENGILVSDNPSVDEIVNKIIAMKIEPEFRLKIKANLSEDRYLYDRRNYINEQVSHYKNLIDSSA